VRANNLSASCTGLALNMPPRRRHHHPTKQQKRQKVSGLASHVPYEFRFAAVNELGIGPWSDPSPACQTPVFAGNLPKNQALLNMDQWLLRLGQVLRHAGLADPSHARAKATNR